MKLLTREQEQAHYNATLTGGIIGGSTGLAVGALGVLAASRRYQFFRQLTLPLKAFLVTSSGTFAGIISADHSSRSYEREQNPIDREYDARQREQAEAAKAGKTFTQRAMEYGKKERYKIVGASWIASMIAAFALVNRNKYLTGQQKLVQARVYAQFLTVGVLVATAAFEISDRNNEEGRYETIKVVDPTDPEHKRMIEKQRYVGESQSDGDSMWKEMVEAEEQRIKEREEEEKELRAKKHKKHDQQQQSQQKKKSADKDKDSQNDNKKDGEKGESKKDEGKDKDKDKDSQKDNKSDGGKDESKEDDGKDTRHVEKHEENEKQKKIPSANDAKNNK